MNIIHGGIQRRLRLQIVGKLLLSFFFFF
uniref:Uncharacterized protein n=1 Tax=Rhizophora mucronata TaxID=61149 RepID=A0A2P2KUQ0_RHIMU